MKVFLILLALAMPCMAGEFVKRAMGRDENGKPAYQYVYQAGKSRYASSPSTSRRGYGYGYAYSYPRSYVIRRTPSWHHRPRPVASTKRYRATTTPLRRGR
ncbi:MAG: hypothetical protein ACI8T1_000476 [Verrucomicrobiales bacterium]|jgi:hypothetical protein